MSNFDPNEIKYYPDRFYLRLDGFDTKKLTTFLTNMEVDEQQAVFIHEYYHYLTNIATYPGIRQFNANFCDRYRIIINLLVHHGIDGFPINTNAHADCQPNIKYWESVRDIIDRDDLNYKLVEEVNNSYSKKFDITSINIREEQMEMEIAGEVRTGSRGRVSIQIEGLINIHAFDLTFGALDEFFSSTIDEYLCEHEISETDVRMLANRPFYPYRFFESLLRFHNLGDLSTRHKIYLVYFALNSQNPPVKLIEIMQSLQGAESEDFQKDAEAYLLSHFKDDPRYQDALAYTKKTYEEMFGMGSVHIAQALKFFHDRFYIACKFKEDDFFYFIRPFTVEHSDKILWKQRFLLALGRIINQFPPPIILKEGVFHYVDKVTTFGEATLLMIAIYEIYESLKNNAIAQRPSYLKAKYSFPDQDSECDNPTTFRHPITGIIFQLALNEMGMVKLYTENLGKVMELLEKQKV